jgi:hypothetical protein
MPVTPSVSVYAATVVASDDSIHALVGLHFPYFA